VPGLPVKLTIKRAIDLLGAALGLVISSVVMLACAIAIKLHDGGPILYRHTRVGRGGRHFSLYKLRTMCVGAEDKQGELEAHNEQDGPVFKMREDPRITSLGRLLRKYSLDELPQLFNVLRGDMSLVGPRPPTPDEVRQYDWWQRRRLSIRPGLTCIWQVWGRNAVSFDRWMEMDLYYIDNWSLWMDMKLLLRTMPAVARGTGM
jgi:lipopolysaccharide/colanic/teichoic acid biosynthesis glycosyltransferase